MPPDMMHRKEHSITSGDEVKRHFCWKCINVIQSRWNLREGQTVGHSTKITDQFSQNWNVIKDKDWGAIQTKETDETSQLNATEFSLPKRTWLELTKFE